MLEQDNGAGWLFKFSATVVVGIAVAAYVWRRNKERLLDEVGNVGASEVICFCGLPAKLRISRTSKDPYRLFYRCPKNAYCDQCKFFRWSDEIPIDMERCLEEKVFLRDECIRLQQRIDHIQSKRQQEARIWEAEKTDLRSQLSVVQSELDDINKKIREVNESELMPPVDDSYYVDDEQDGAIIIRTVEE